MKKILLSVITVLLVCSCYEPYVKDYEFSAAYIAYQYDLRSFIPGEFTDFDFGACYAGDMENDKDRDIYYVMDDALLTKDLSVYGGTEAFTALDGMKGSAGCGKLSQGYVTEAVNAAGLTALTPLPQKYFTLSDENKIVIAEGNHTGVVKLTVNEDFFADKHVGVNPYYAVGYRITKADADKVLTDRCFSVIALRVENTFFGDWYHGGESWKVDAAGKKIAGSEEVYPTKKPCDDNSFYKYTLTSASAGSVTTSYFHNQAGAMTIGMNGTEVTISDPEGRIMDLGCSWNEAKCLQDRQIYLNYKYAEADGSSVVVKDTLSFRARTRDGINEWQDENPEHYK